MASVRLRQRCHCVLPSAIEAAASEFRQATDTFRKRTEEASQHTGYLTECYFLSHLKAPINCAVCYDEIQEMQCNSNMSLATVRFIHRCIRGCLRHSGDSINIYGSFPRCARRHGTRFNDWFVPDYQMLDGSPIRPLILPSYDNSMRLAHECV